LSYIINYLEPVKRTWNSIYGISHDESLGGNTIFFDGAEETVCNTSAETVIIGVAEDRNSSENRFCSKSPNIIRELLYGLRLIKGQRLLDAGNVRGITVNDRYRALQEVAEFFLKSGKTLIVLGGTQDLTIPLYNALETVKKNVIVTVCDSMIDFDISGKDFSSRAWINSFTGNNKPPDDLTIMGIQNYLVSESLENEIKNNFFEILRLSEIRGNNLKKAEVPLRDSDLFSFDQRAVVGKFAFGEKIASPHGLEPYEACKICQYAGLSDKLSVMGIFEVTSETKLYGFNNEALAAQMVWHFMEGVSERYADCPSTENLNYKNYSAFLETSRKEIQFFNNETNGRWWMETPSQDGKNKIVSCNYEDYVKALENEFPEKWWRLFMKNNSV